MAETVLQVLKKILLPLFVAGILFAPRAMIIREEWSRYSQHNISISAVAKEPRACKWDCQLYVEIATGASVEKELTAFFPAWSTLLRWSSKLISDVPVSTLAFYLSNLFLILSAALAFQLASDLSLATNATQYLFLPLGLLLFPFSVPSSFGYGEPLFLFLYILAFSLLLRHKLISASVVIGLLGVTRPQGVWLAGVFSLLMAPNLIAASGIPIWNPWKWPKPLSWKVVSVSIFLALAPFLAYLLWQRNVYHDAFAFLRAQYVWKRHFTPMRAILDQLPRPKMFPIMIWICLIGSFFALKKRDLSWAFLGLSTIALTEIPLFSGGLMSYARFLSANFGLFLFTGEFLKKIPARYSRYVELALILWAVIAFVAEMNEYLFSPGYCP